MEETGCAGKSSHQAAITGNSGRRELIQARFVDQINSAAQDKDAAGSEMLSAAPQTFERNYPQIRNAEYEREPRDKVSCNEVESRKGEGQEQEFICRIAR